MVMVGWYKEIKSSSSTIGSKKIISEIENFEKISSITIFRKKKKQKKQLKGFLYGCH